MPSVRLHDPSFRGQWLALGLMKEIPRRCTGGDSAALHPSCLHAVIKRAVSLVVDRQRLGIDRGMRMFGLFGKKKALEQFAATIATMINGSFWSLRKDNDGDLPEEMSNDRFVLGYICGVTGGMNLAGRFSKPKDKGSVLVAVHDLLFPGRGMEIARKGVEWLKNKDEVFTRAFKIAVEETVIARMKYMANEKKALEEGIYACKTFHEYLRTHYSQDNDT